MLASTSYHLGGGFWHCGVHLLPRRGKLYDTERNIKRRERICSCRTRHELARVEFQWVSAPLNYDSRDIMSRPLRLVLWPFYREGFLRTQ